VIRSLLPLVLIACGPKVAKTPTVGQIFAAYDRAVHADKADAPGQLEIVIETTMQGQDIVTTTRIVSELPDHLLSVTEIPGMGALITGYDGTTAWSAHPLAGMSVLTGPDRDGLVRSIDDMSKLRISQQYSDATLFGSETFEGQDAWRVDATDSSGLPATLWFSPDTGLKVGDSTLGGPGGDVAITQVFHAYTEFDGLLVPSRTEQRMGQMVLISEVQSYRTEGFEMPDFSAPSGTLPDVEEVAAP
jgi:hypothetical protein